MTGVMFFAPQAMAHGWTQDQLFELHAWCRENRVATTNISYDMAVLSDGRIHYRGRDFSELEKSLPGPVDVYCDGSGTVDNKPAGIGVVILGDRPQLLHESAGLGTNNHAELWAIRRSLMAIPYLGSQIRIHSDSAWAIGAVSASPGWNITKNVGLVEAIRNDLSARNGRVAFVKVDGHAGVLWNEVADCLARAGRLGKPPEYPSKLQKMMAAI